MDGDTMEGFLAHPEQLSDASKTVDRCSDDLTQARTDISMLPPAEAFGLLPGTTPSSTPVMPRRSAA